jgi:hypothetical protein
LQLQSTISFTVLITDGVCGVFDQNALQGAISQLRLNAISCSFIQLHSASLRGPVLGHVAFPELFSFIATATFGTFLFESDLEGPKGPDGLNPVQRAFLTWTFRKGLPEMGGICGGAGKNTIGEQQLPTMIGMIGGTKFVK